MQKQKTNAMYPEVDEEVECKEVTRWATGTVVRLTAFEGAVEVKLTLPPKVDIFNEGRTYRLMVFDDTPDEDPTAPGSRLTWEDIEQAMAPGPPRSDVIIVPRWAKERFGKLLGIEGIDWSSVAAEVP